MARKSSIVKNERRLEIANRLREKRDALRNVVKSVTASYEEKLAASLALNKMPRDSSLIRYRNRCMFTGRCRSVYRKYKLSRLTLREMASKGEIPGMIKASW